MKVRLFSIRVAIAGACLVVLVAAAQTLALPSNLISLDSETGGQLLIESSARQAYWPLSIQFVTQKNQAYCGVASMVMVLNAMGVSAPATPDIEPFRTFTQDNVLNLDTERILPVAQLLENGMTLDQFGQLLGVHGGKVQIYHANESSVDHFRTVAARALGARDQHVVVNYLRRALGQERGGHISPLAAFDAKTDRFLVLDVSRYKYPPVWVKTTELYAAMDTVDSDNQNRRRGFVLVAKSSNSL
jgi:hypothetical protein